MEPRSTDIHLLRTVSAVIFSLKSTLLILKRKCKFGTMINDREVLLDELVTVTVKKLTFSRKNVL